MDENEVRGPGESQSPPEAEAPAPAKSGGKRLADSGGGAKKAVIAVAVLAAVLAAGYVGLCAYASRDAMWPHTAVMGVDVSGLSRASALEKLESELPAVLAGKNAVVREPSTGVSAEFSGGVMEVTDLAGAVDSACFRGENFFLRGWKYLAALTSPQYGGGDWGVDLELTAEGEEQFRSVMADIAKAAGVDGNETTYSITDTAVLFEKGVTGRAVDMDGARKGLRHAISGAGPETVEVSIIEAPPAEPDFQAIADKIYAVAADAYLDPETKEIVPAVIGKVFDVEAAQAALAGTAEGKLCRVELDLTVPEMTTETLSENLFREVLGEAVTRVTGTSDRKKSIKNAANLINGTILLPGEEFSYNSACEPYSVTNGYGHATAYVNGLSVDTVAGGICQMSSTLHWAALKANLEITERSAHRYEPDYISGGLDATVYSGSPDFKFKNDTDYPVKLETYMDDKSYVHAVIYGTNTTGIHGEPYSTNRVVTRYAKTVYEPRDSIPQGTTRKDPERTAYNAVSIDTYLKLVDAEGNVVETKFLYNTKYKYRDAVIFYNPADIWLWNIDPATGVKLPDAQTSPAPGESLPPAESGAPTESGVPMESGAPAESGQPLVTQPAESLPPVTETPAAETPAGVETGPLLPAETPTPVLTPPPGPTADPEEPVLPPEA